MAIYTLRGCTIEVPKGGRSATATRHTAKDGKPIQPPEVATFGVLGADHAPTPEVQAQHWALGLPQPPAAEPLTPEESTDLEEARDGE